ncbi:NAD(P)H-dependent oxidoreductase subunit E [Novipirellula artificiosorum]|uniref:NADP-reducing hydrogenase subunit HndC n=1 Tax=Novipirellula artificiosorum TaxID=2528016 RepID=A0A5C6E5J1_9BACT|nr:NAD(P)H-dependent oxidoreductase subunit E [Novipirellula artificiosorum]TWU42419.1 NADP-reducing hydrogenase subunit HndC [Novipirellula artificiosorum]
MSEIDLTFVDDAIERTGRGPEAVIPILQQIQQHYRYLPETALRHVCAHTQITPASIEGVSTFYTQFRHEPVGNHLIHVCLGTACHVKGAQLVMDSLRTELKIAKGEDTDRDGKFTLQSVACLGCCTLAPVVQIDEVTYGGLTPKKIPEMLHDFRVNHSGVKAAPSVRHHNVGESIGEIRIGMGSCCVAQGSAKVRDAVERVLSESGACADVKRVGCVGMCHQTPLVEIVPKSGDASLYARVQPEDAESLVLKHFKPKGMMKRLTYGAERWLDRFMSDDDDEPTIQKAISPREGAVCAFLGPQKHLATEYCGQIDPMNLDEYRRHDGFVALKKAIEIADPGKLIDEVQKSGLRGRGGAGFPTGIKWQKVREVQGDKKYIICNGDEGDPGAFMDRMLLESFPYRIIEGMAIAALSVGSREGYFYVRAEYPLAVKRIREAIKICEDQGILGDHVLGSDFSLKLGIMEGAGAFVCGEETALLASMQGERGMPHLRPPYPAELGLWKQPTLINNVETYALVPWIIRNGSDAFAALGTEKSKGTKVFALAGKVARGGLIEVPMGITMRQVIDDVGGGVANGKKLKAVQVGGPSGGCLPAELAETSIDYESLAEVGAIMGSGGLVVLDEDDCMVDIARYFLRFTQDQSCGKCTFCRVGTRRLLDILDRICEGKGKKGDLDTLERLSHDVSQGSLCGLGKTAPNPVLSMLKYFRHEFEAHLEGRCPAGKCIAMIEYKINDKCIGCTLCAQECPVDAIPMTPYRIHTIDSDKCTRCDTCAQVCPEDAVYIE